MVSSKFLPLTTIQLSMKQLTIAFIFCICTPLFAQHTFSICAVDPVTGEVGSAGASCIENSHIISDVHPGVGVIHTQAYYVPGNQNYAEDLMNLGVAPAAIIDSLVLNDFFGNATIRQYGVVDLVDGGRSAAYTGESCSEWKGHLTGVTYAIQGNILLGPEILDGMETNFIATDGNLACKLMAALQGAKVPGADTRCLDAGISALSAFIRVAKSTDEANSLWLDLKVIDVEGDSIDPIDSLQTIFDALGGCDFTGLNDIRNNDAAPVIYPQPSMDVIIFSLNNNFDVIEIYDLNGRLLFTENTHGKNSIAINSADWDTGIYLYMLSKEDRVTSGKIIVE